MRTKELKTILKKNPATAKELMIKFYHQQHLDYNCITAEIKVHRAIEPEVS